MRARRGALSGAVKAFGAGLAVYVGVAACSASGGEQARHVGAGGAGHTSGAGGVGVSGDGGAAGHGGGLIDAASDVLADVWGDVVNPVPDADAAPPPDVRDVPCSGRAQSVADSRVIWHYAEVTGLPHTAEQLAFAKVLMPAANPDAPATSGDWYAASPSVSDGRVVTTCGYTVSGDPYGTLHASVRFIIPAP